MQNALLLSLALLVSTTSLAKAQANRDHPRQMKGEDWPGCKQCGVEGCKGHGLTPNDPGYYGRASADRTPVGTWAPFIALSVIFTIFAVLLRNRIRRAEGATQQHSPKL